MPMPIRTVVTSCWVPTSSSKPSSHAPPTTTPLAAPLTMNTVSSGTIAASTPRKNRTLRRTIEPKRISFSSDCVDAVVSWTSTTEAMPPVNPARRSCWASASVACARKRLKDSWTTGSETLPLNSTPIRSNAGAPAPALAPTTRARSPCQSRSSAATPAAARWSAASMRPPSRGLTRMVTVVAPSTWPKARRPNSVARADSELLGRKAAVSSLVTSTPFRPASEARPMPAMNQMRITIHG
jgi:hypothetical protein